MKKNISALLLIFLCSGFAMMTLAQDKGVFTDKRDNKSYNYEKIGKQVWMLQNLAFDVQPGSYIYSNDTTFSGFGRLYEWNAAMKACPKGWRVPNDLEWTALLKTLGGEDAAGEKLLAYDTVKKSQWAKNPALTGGFSSLLGGVRHADSTYTGASVWGGCWSATATPEGASNYLFVKNGKSVGKSSATKVTGYYVRCIRVK